MARKFVKCFEEFMIDRGFSVNHKRAELNNLRWNPVEAELRRINNEPMGALGRRGHSSNQEETDKMLDNIECFSSYHWLDIEVDYPTSQLVQSILINLGLDYVIEICKDKIFSYVHYTISNDGESLSEKSINSDNAEDRESSNKILSNSDVYSLIQRIIKDGRDISYNIYSEDMSYTDFDKKFTIDKYIKREAEEVFRTNFNRLRIKFNCNWIIFEKFITDLTDLRDRIDAEDDVFLQRLKNTDLTPLREEEEIRIKSELERIKADFHLSSDEMKKHFTKQTYILSETSI